MSALSVSLQRHRRWGARSSSLRHRRPWRQHRQRSPERTVSAGSANRSHETDGTLEMGRRDTSRARRPARARSRCRRADLQQRRLASPTRVSTATPRGRLRLAGQAAVTPSEPIVKEATSPESATARTALRRPQGGSCMSFPTPRAHHRRLSPHHRPQESRPSRHRDRKPYCAGQQSRPMMRSDGTNASSSGRDSIWKAVTSTSSARVSGDGSFVQSIGQISPLA